MPKPSIQILHITPIHHVCIALNVSALNRSELSEEKPITPQLEEKCKQQPIPERKLVKLLVKYPQLLEFIHVTGIIEGIPAYVAHQLVRHRHVSWMMESRRHSEPPSIPADLEALGVEHDIAKELTDAYLRAYDRYEELARKGVPLELATRILPPIDERTLMFTGNLRAISEMICRRICTNAQNETRKTIEMLIEAITKKLPWYREFIEKYCLVEGPCIVKILS